MSGTTSRGGLKDGESPSHARSIHNVRGAIFVSLIWLASAPLAFAQDAAPPEDADPEADTPPPEPQDDDAPIQMDRDDSMLNDERARGHFRAGQSLYDVGDFERAAEEFDQAYELSGRPALLRNMYVAHRDAGHSEQALTALEGYLEQVPDAEDRGNLESRLTALRIQVERERQLEADTAEAQRLAQEEERRRRQAEEDAENAASPVPWVVAGVGALAMGAGLVTGLLASSATSDIEAMCPGDICPASYTALEEDRDSARTLVTITDYTLLAGGVLLVGGLTWGLLSLGGSGDSDEDVAAAAMCSPTGCSGSMTVDF